MYDAGSSLGNGPKFTFSGKPDDRGRHDSPGPGAYDARMEATKSSNPGAAFSK